MLDPPPTIFQQHILEWSPSILIPLLEFNPMYVNWIICSPLWKPFFLDSEGLTSILYDIYTHIIKGIYIYILFPTLTQLSKLFLINRKKSRRFCEPRLMVWDRGGRESQVEIADLGGGGGVNGVKIGTLWVWN